MRSRCAFAVLDCDCLLVLVLTCIIIPDALQKFLRTSDLSLAVLRFLSWQVTEGYRKIRCKMRQPRTQKHTTRHYI